MEIGHMKYCYVCALVATFICWLHIYFVSMCLFLCYRPVEKATVSNAVIGLTVCLSNTRLYCIKTAKHVTISHRLVAPTLYFSHTKGGGEIFGFTPTGCFEYCWGIRNYNFTPISCYKP